MLLEIVLLLTQTVNKTGHFSWNVKICISKKRFKKKEREILKIPEEFF